MSGRCKSHNAVFSGLKSRRKGFAIAAGVAAKFALTVGLTAEQEQMRLPGTELDAVRLRDLEDGGPADSGSTRIPVSPGGADFEESVQNLGLHVLELPTNGASLPA